jgi:HK97 family phage portal protein
MAIFNRMFEIKNTTYTLQDTTFLQALGVDTTTISNNKLQEITFFTCLKHLSECLGKLPINKYMYDVVKGKEKAFDSNLNRILNLEPNPYYTSTTFWQAIELNRNYYGNGLAYIERHKSGKLRGQVKALWILPANEVNIYVDDAGIFGSSGNMLWYVWTDSRGGKKYTFASNEVLHFKSSTTFDGIIGIAVKDVLKTQVETAQYSQSYLQKLYKGNMFGGKILLQYTGDMAQTGKDALIKETERYANSVGTGKFLPIPAGISATMLDMKLTDAEFEAISKLSALQIAAAFGIKPNILNNYDKSSYSNSETQQLDFYINSLLPILKGYKEENTRKLISPIEQEKYFFEHNIKELFKLDPSKQMEVLQKGMNNLLYTVNEAREELGLSYIDNPKANMPVGNGNYITLDQIGNQWQKGGENTGE